MKTNKFSIKARLRSFKYAFNGFRILVREEHNSWIHLFATFCVLIAGILLRITVFEWIAVAFAIGFVISFEIINSAIENMADFISPERHDSIKKIKDLSAAGVLLSAFTAAIIGILVFLPRLISLFE